MEHEAKIWVGVVFAVLVAILSKLWDPIAAHVGYPFGVDRRVKDLQETVKPLIDMRRELRERENLLNSRERIGWLDRVDNLVEDVERIKADLENCGPIDYFKKCFIGREADTELKKANSLNTQGVRLMPAVDTSLTRQGRRSLPQADSGQPQEVPRVTTIPPGMGSSYRKVLNFIKNNRSESCMGIWGMGGVGKTKLINLVCDSRSAEYDDYFSDVLLVQAGKGCRVADLQKRISVSMGLRQIDNEISQSAIISDHLQRKDFLLLVDDLWEYIDLNEVGIPLLDEAKKPRRKVVFTSRSMEVCDKMISPWPSSDHPPRTRTIQMRCLNKEDAWSLFAENVGSTTIFEHVEIRKAAEKIVEE